MPGYLNFDMEPQRRPSTGSNSMAKISIHEMTPEQQEAQRKTWQEAQAASRAAKKEATTPDYAEWSWDFDERFPTQYEELRAYRDEFISKIATELGRELNDLEHETLYWLSTVSYCTKKDASPWIRKVNNPGGLVYGGGLYADVIGDDLIRNTYHFDLKKSSSYLEAYQALLVTLNRKFGRNSNDSGSEGDAARTVKAELAGKYVPPSGDQVTLRKSGWFSAVDVKSEAVAVTK